MAKIEITDQLAFDCASLLYAEWARAFDHLKIEKGAKPDPEDKDWKLFHDANLILLKEKADKAKLKSDTFNAACKAAGIKFG